MSHRIVEKEESSQTKIFYGWIITGVVFINLAMAYGAQYSFGVLFPSLMEEFHWTRQSISGAFSLYNFMYSVLGVILGRWADRFGPRVILIFGSVLLGGGIALISVIQAPWHLYVVYGLLASWGMSATYITANPTVVKWFIAKRGLAVGVAQSGLGVGIIVIPPLCGMLIAAFGWRQACIVLGLAVFVILFFMSLFLVGYPEKIGLYPDGRREKAAHGLFAPAAAIREITWSAAEAIHTRSFWILTALYFCTWLFVFVPLVHLVIFSIDIGLGQKSAFIALGVLGAGSTLGRLIMGYISDRIGRRPALAINLGLQIFSWFWIMGTGTNWMLFLFAAVFGFSYGGVSAIFPAIVGDYFGRLRAASIIGAIFTIAGVASAIGPVLAGYIYDLGRSYQPAFLLGAVTNMMALILIFVSHPPVRGVRSGI
jgi:MFS transporter, OFA family, oxalate/formate antiporter